MDKKQISEYMSKLGKLSYKKSPRSREFYQRIARKSHKVRRGKLTGKDNSAQTQ